MWPRSRLDGSSTSILDYFGHNLRFCGPLGLSAYFNDTVTPITQSYFPNPVTMPQQYWNKTDATKTFWTPSYGLNTGQTDYPFVACRWETTCYDPENYVVSIWSNTPSHVGNHTIWFKAFLQDYHGHIFSVFIPMHFEIISCEPGTIEPSFIPDFYYQYG